MNPFISYRGTVYFLPEGGLPMSGKFVSFNRVQPNQYFHSNGQTWIKSHGPIRKGGFTFNSYEFSIELLSPTPSIIIGVRDFDEATLVKIDSTLPLYSGHIVLKDFGKFGNDN